MLLGDNALRELKAKICYNDNEVLLLGKRHVSGEAGSTDLVIASVGLNIDKWAKEFPDLFDDKCHLTMINSHEADIGKINHHPVSSTAYRLPFRKREMVETELDQMLEDDIIEPSSSPWASPLVLVPKKDGSIRTCIDFRRINAITQRDAYPLPSIDDIFDSMNGATLFSTLDLRSGYWQIPLEESCREKTAFICHRGFYQFKRLPFGLMNAPAIFQRFLNKLLAPFLGKFCCVYLDDIVIFSKKGWGAWGSSAQGFHQTAGAQFEIETQ